MSSTQIIVILYPHMYLVDLNPDKSYQLQQLNKSPEIFWFPNYSHNRGYVVT